VPAKYETKSTNASHISRPYISVRQNPEPTLSSRRLLLSSNGAYSTIRCILNTGMCTDLALVMSHCSLGDRAHIAGACLQHVGVIRRKHSCGCAHYGAESVIHLFCLWLIDCGLEGRA